MNIIKRWLTNNLDIKILALLMSIILWFYIASEYNILSEKYFEIEVVPINLNDNLYIKEIRERVSVGIKGPQNIVENITTARIIGTVNLQKIMTPGEYLVDVNVIPPKGTEVTKIIPKEIRILLEEIISKEYLVEYNLIGLPEKGYSLKDIPEIVPKNVLITAPESVHKIIGQVRVDIDISSINSDITRREKVTVFTKEGAILNNLNIIPENVSISIQVREGYPEKITTIRPRIIGKPAPGFYISKIEANPNTFKIYGEYTKITNIDFLETIPIDINGISKTLTVKVPPILTEGIYLDENQESLIEIKIQVEEREEEKIFPNIKIELRNASPFVNYRLIPEMVEAKITGRYSILKNIKEEDIKIYANLSDIDIDSVKLQAEIPPNIELISITPDEVKVSIKK